MSEFNEQRFCCNPACYLSEVIVDDKCTVYLEYAGINTQTIYEQYMQFTAQPSNVEMPGPKYINVQRYKHVRIWTLEDAWEKKPQPTNYIKSYKHINKQIVTLLYKFCPTCAEAIKMMGEHVEPLEATT